MNKQYDVVIVGAGIVGLASAYAAVNQGLSVAVVERNAQCVSASVRNFGFVTVSGQKQGEHWQRARKSRDVWAEIAPQAGIDVIHSGLHMLAQRPQALEVAEAFLSTDMGAQCRLLSSREIAEQVPYLQAGAGVLYSPHELRVESSSAIGLLAQWLADTHGVDFYFQTAVTAIDGSDIQTSRGRLSALYCVVCPGADMSTLYPETMSKAKAQLCTLNMLRVMPTKPFTLNAAVMSDLSFARYEGFALLPEGQALAALLDEQQVAHRKAGVHVIVVQSADGSLVIGDSHVYGEAEQPFRDEHFDDLILDEFHQMMAVGEVEVIERWNGVYTSAADVVFKDKPQDNVIIGLVTGGTGASTGFAFGEELINEVMQ